jgi:UDP-N-acetylglucosamine:LPS N-acetylglucosamine transferase
MKRKKVLAVASGGGHWKQLMLLEPAFTGHNVKFVTTIEGLAAESGISNYIIVKDSNQNMKLKLLHSLFEIFFIVIKFRPDVIVTTGAAPGVLAIFVGRLIRAKTIWVDSVANSEELSLGGKISRKISNIVLTQWEHLASEDSIQYKGSVF